MTLPVDDNTIPKAYIPADYETSVYKMWMDNDFFKPVTKNGKDPFVIIMPLFNSISAPIFFKACRLKSTGLGPQAQPPGRETSA